MSNRKIYQYYMTLVFNAVSVILSVVTTFLVFDVWMGRVLHTYPAQDFIEFFLLIVLSFIITGVLFDPEDDILTRSKLREVLRIFQFNLLFISCLTILMVVTKSALTDSRYLIFGIYLFNHLYLALCYRLQVMYLRNPHIGKTMIKNTGILTTAERAPVLTKDLKEDWTKNILGLALVDSSADETTDRIEGVQVCAFHDNFMDWVRSEALDEVYLDIPYDRGDSLLPVLVELESMGLDVHFNIPLLERLYSTDMHGVIPRKPRGMECHAGSYMVTLSTTNQKVRDLAFKRTLDVLGGLVGFILSVPLILLVAIPLKLESPGPLFFVQKRVGLNGRIFSMYKLRSMYIDAEERKKELMAKNEMNGLMFKMKDDPRITKVGKFIRKTSIDELPQFYNVLRGDMSLVGTRPPTLDEYAQYESHHKRRLSMKPGITGMWQVSGRSDIENFEDVVRLDVEYIDNWTPMLDIKILFKTVLVVFTKRGAE